jgi:ribosomal-protein-alanine N-acetyltransferase
VPSGKVPSVLLRPFSIYDYENWRQAYSLMAPAQNVWDEGPWKESELTRAKFREMIRKFDRLRKADDTYVFGVFRLDDGVLVGTVNLMGVSRGIFQNAYLGYRIFNPYWRHGYATQAVKLAVQIAFKDLKLHRIEAGISPKNKASLKLAEAVGLRCEGLSPRRLHIHGKWEDLLLFAGTSEDFGHRFVKANLLRKFTK